jgi:hypothetical protein
MPGRSLPSLIREGIPSMPSNVAIILDLIRREPGLTDSEIRQRTGIDPHQQVNGICNRLAKDGRIRRQRGPRGQWVNLPSDAGRTIRSPDTSMHPTVAARERDALARRSPGYTPPLGPWGAYPMLSDLDPARTLIVLPCSATKEPGGRLAGGASLPEQLSADLASRLLDARRAVGRRSPRDDIRLMPAMDRYRGSYYQAAGGAIARASAAGARILIISGGYGLVLPTELIADYKTVFRLNWWPSGLLQECLIASARRLGLTSMVAFLSRTTEYAKLVRSTRWEAAGVTRALLVNPASYGATGTQVTVPRAAGSAFTAFWEKTLQPGWSSPDGLRLAVDVLK